jgi:type II secretory pathway component PulJ
MQDQPNIPLLIALALLALGLLITVGGFDDASVRDLNNQHLLQTFNF